MTRTEHLLTILGEECAEVAQRASKALRFTLQDVQPGQSLSNADRIMLEYADLCAVIDMLCDEGLLEIGGDFAALVAAKKQQVEHYLKYSAVLGATS